MCLWTTFFSCILISIPPWLLRTYHFSLVTVYVMAKDSHLNHRFHWAFLISQAFIYHIIYFNLTIIWWYIFSAILQMRWSHRAEEICLIHTQFVIGKLEFEPRKFGSKTQKIQSANTMRRRSGNLCPLTSKYQSLSKIFSFPEAFPGSLTTISPSIRCRKMKEYFLAILIFIVYLTKDSTLIRNQILESLMQST